MSRQEVQEQLGGGVGRVNTRWGGQGGVNTRWGGQGGYRSSFMLNRELYYDYLRNLVATVESDYSGLAMIIVRVEFNHYVEFIE